MDKLQERTAAMVSRVADLKRTSAAANELSDALDQDKDKLSAASKSALEAYNKSKEDQEYRHDRNTNV